MATPQQIIAHYRIVSKLGEGGMGEVWRATDTRLNREVAIKVLPAAFAGDEMRMARFAREAQVLASLNHPGIAAIYGVEERALVMELVEGPTLAEKIPRSGMPIEDALPIALQIAEALEYAHEKGVIHRDLKPANIKITPEGRVKILDFGLAKATSAESSASGSAEAATLSSPATLAGTILGTAAYMSPEQARGGTVDRRADIWAFGVVLYEMLAGERPFGGPTISDTLAAVLKSEPDLTKLPATILPVIAGSLRKDLRQRWHDIGDVRLALEGKLPTLAASEANRRFSRGHFAVFSLGAAVIALAAGLAVWFLKPGPAPAPMTSFTLAPPENTQFKLGAAALSPDGRRMVFAAAAPRAPAQLWLRRFDSVAAVPLPQTYGIDVAGWSSLFWAPDGNAIGYFANGNLMRLDLNGGAATPLAPTGNDVGGSWSPRGIIVYGPGGPSPLLRVPAGGGAPLPATVLNQERGESAHRFPWFLPDGIHFLFIAVGPDLIEIGSLDDSRVRVIGPTESNVIYGAGYLIYQRDSVLLAQPFDARRLLTTGSAEPIGASVAVQRSATHVFIGTAGDTFFFGPGSGANNQRLAWLDVTGGHLADIGEPDRFGQLALAPDGRRAVVSVESTAGGKQTSDLWIYSLDSTVRSRLTFDGTAQASNPVWSPDGTQIVFHAKYGAYFDLYRIPANGSTPETLLYADVTSKTPTALSRDGKYLLYNGDGGAWVLSLDGKSKPRLLIAGGNNAQFSPDGRWISYQSSDSGRVEVFLIAFPKPGGKFLVSTAGGRLARWRADGHELFYIGGDGRLMVAAISLLESSVDIGPVQPLFTGALAGGFRYDVSADGQRVLAVTQPEAPAAQLPLTIMEHWTTSLKH